MASVSLAGISSVSGLRCRMSKAAPPTSLYLFHSPSLAPNAQIEFTSLVRIFDLLPGRCRDSHRCRTRTRSGSNSCQMSLTFGGRLNELCYVCAAHNSCHCGWLISPLPWWHSPVCAPRFPATASLLQQPTQFWTSLKTFPYDGEGQCWWHLYKYI